MRVWLLEKGNKMKAPKNPNGKHTTMKPSEAIPDTPIVTAYPTAEFLWKTQDSKDEEIERLKKELEEVRSRLSGLEARHL